MQLEHDRNYVLCTCYGNLMHAGQAIAMEECFNIKGAVLILGEGTNDTNTA